VVWRIVQGSVQGPFELPNLLDIDPTANPDNGYGNAVSLNDNNQIGLATVVGHFYLSEEITESNPGGASNSPTHAARWTIAFDETGQLLVTADIIANGAAANNVSDQDVACGEIIDSIPSPVAAVWSPNEKILHRLRDVQENSAWHINTAGLIVGTGYVDRSEFGWRAVMWADSTSKMTRLDKFLSRRSSLGQLNIATAVNDNDVIVGTATNGGFLAVPQ
jgi:hypothetical protein